MEGVRNKMSHNLMRQKQMGRHICFFVLGAGNEKTLTAYDRSNAAINFSIILCFGAGTIQEWHLIKSGIDFSACVDAATKFCTMWLKGI